MTPCHAAHNKTQTADVFTNTTCPKRRNRTQAPTSRGDSVPWISIMVFKSTKVLRSPPALFNFS